jgi:hypothetical protein
MTKLNSKKLEKRRNQSLVGLTPGLVAKSQTKGKNMNDVTGERFIFEM